MSLLKRFLLFLIPIATGLTVFGIFLFYYLQTANGKGALQVTSVPSATVYLNGKMLGKTPLCQCEGKDMVATGNYTIKLVPQSGDNLSSYEENITIAKGILTVVDRTFGAPEFSSGSVITLVALPDKKAIQLFLASFPTDAKIRVDGQDMGQTPLLIKSLTDSDHEIILTKDGYKDKTVHVHTVAGYQLKALITLGLVSKDATTSAQIVAPTAAPIVKTSVTILDTPTGFLRVRVEPSLGASETAQVKPGDVLEYLDEENGWFEIKLPTGGNGWISAQYAKKQ